MLTYRESPDRKNEIERKQSQIDVLQASLKTILSHKDPLETLEWIKSFCKIADDIDVKYDAKKICKELERAGYTENDFISVHDSVFTTPYRLECWIVGQAINCMKQGLPPHPMLGEEFYDDYLAMI